MHDARVVRLGLPHLVQDLGRLLLVGEGLVGRRLGRVQRQRIEDAGLLVVGEAGVNLLHRLLVGDRAGLVVELVVISIERGDRRDIGLLALGLRPGGVGLRDRFGAGLQRRLARRVPQRIPVAHRDAPIGHRAVGLRLGDVAEAFQRLRVPERVQRPGGVVERLLRRRAARDREIDLLDRPGPPRRRGARRRPSVRRAPMTTAEAREALRRQGASRSGSLTFRSPAMVACDILYHLAGFDHGQSLACDAEPQSGPGRFMRPSRPLPIDRRNRPSCP